MISVKYQIIMIFYSFIYGLIMNKLVVINEQFIIRYCFFKKNIYRILFVVDFSLLFLLFMYFLVDGVFNYYYIIFLSLGYFFPFVKKCKQLLN